MRVEDLGPAGVRALEAVKVALGRSDLVARAPVVESYVLAVDLLERMQQEHARLGHPVIADGYRGSVTSHPLPGEIRRQARVVVDLERSLGLTRAQPRSMVGKNLRAPDRVARPELREVKDGAA